MQLVGRTLLSAGELLQIHIGTALDGDPGWAADRSQQDLQLPGHYLPGCTAYTAARLLRHWQASHEA
jgi:hypothetical protein